MGMFFTPNGIVVTSGGAAADAALIRLEQAIASGEASGVIVSAADNASPIVGTYNDAQLIGDLQRAGVEQDWNAFTREAFASVLGALAGLAALPAGPAASVATDMAFSEAFKRAYDAASALSKSQNWSALLDLIDAAKNALYGSPAVPAIDPATRFDPAQRYLTPPSRDPLTLDLDGDGLETVAASVGVLFDHDGDGIKNGTGWIQADDGLLVLDRNGNGSIDSGRELFGDSTPLAGGGTAADGFAALAQEDTSLDGKVDAGDARWAGLRVWQDANQDGISQAGELRTLAALDIVSIQVAATAHSQTLPDGNRIADLGSYSRSDGSLGSIASVSPLADVDLVIDTFQRQFPDAIAWTEAARILPEMQGSGALRDLREAASQPGGLAGLLASYAAAPTRAAQLALVDLLLDAWADTGGLAETLEERTVLYKFRYMAFGNVRRGDHLTPALTAGVGVPDTDATGVSLGADANLGRLDLAYRNLIVEWNRKIHILEAFNGRYFFALPEATGETHVGLAAFDGMSERNTGQYYEAASGIKTLLITYTQGQLDLLDQSYDALRESVYGALLLQTRFKGLLDQIDLVIDGDGIRFDFSVLDQSLQNKVAADAATGMSDLIEFNRYAGPMLMDSGWGGAAMLENYLRTLPVSADLQAVYTQLHVAVEGQPGYGATGDNSDNVIIAGAGANVLNGGSAADLSRETKLDVLECFNGRTFNAVPASTGVVAVNLWNTTLPLLQQSYDALKAPVLDDIILQTRLVARATNDEWAKVRTAA
jgi:hypothetical protein